MPASADFFERVARLGREGVAFATATVVGRKPPVSAHLGDRAIVLADGRMEGFVGGACSHEIIRKQALDAIRTGTSRIVSIRPDPENDPGASGSDRVVVSMTCALEGAVEVYVEPFVQPRLLVVAGATPIASALARIARSLDYRVVRVVDDRERTDVEAEALPLGCRVVGLRDLDQELRQADAATMGTAVVAASQGHYDEDTLDVALRCEAPYVGLVASRLRGASVKAILEERGAPGLDGLRNPAGLDLGARTAPEVALSILAEIVQTTVAAGASRAVSAPAAGQPEPRSTAVDPVCGMDVEIATARHIADVEGVTYYFCCAGCRSRFVKQPDAFLTRT